MPDLFTDKVNWPRRIEDGIPLWQHSDMREIAYLYINKFYDQLASISQP